MWRVTFHRAMLVKATVAPDVSSARSRCAIALRCSCARRSMNSRQVMRPASRTTARYSVVSLCTVNAHVDRVVDEPPLANDCRVQPVVLFHDGDQTKRHQRQKRIHQQAFLLLIVGGQHDPTRMRRIAVPHNLGRRAAAARARFATCPARSWTNPRTYPAHLEGSVVLGDGSAAGSRCVRDRSLCAKRNPPLLLRSAARHLLARRSPADRILQEAAPPSLWVLRHASPRLVAGASPTERFIGSRSDPQQDGADFHHGVELRDHGEHETRLLGLDGVTGLLGLDLGDEVAGLHGIAGLTCSRISRTTSSLLLTRGVCRGVGIRRDRSTSRNATSASNSWRSSGRIDDSRLRAAGIGTGGGASLLTRPPNPFSHERRGELGSEPRPEWALLHDRHAFPVLQADRAACVLGTAAAATARPAPLTRSSSPRASATRSTIGSAPPYVTTVRSGDASRFTNVGNNGGARIVRRGRPRLGSPPDPASHRRAACARRRRPGAVQSSVARSSRRPAS